MIGSGVQAGDRVIVEGVQKIKPGVKAQVSAKASETQNLPTPAQK